MDSTKLPTSTVLPISEHETLTKGTYSPARPGDLRSPCPMVNSLANHGYLPRSGRYVHLEDFLSSMNTVGLSYLLGGLFSHACVLDHAGAQSSKPSFLARIWGVVKDPWSTLPRSICMHPAGQVDTQGKSYVNLDQLALHGAIEHDISLSRRDAGQGDNVSAQKDLVAQILAASSDGRSLTMADMCELRRRRIETQKAENKQLQYGKLEHELGCGEIALILKVLGDGKQVKVDYLQALFGEERLPIREGWTKRAGLWSVGLLEVKLTVEKIKKVIGVSI